MASLAWIHLFSTYALSITTKKGKEILFVLTEHRSRIKK